MIRPTTFDYRAVDAAAIAARGSQSIAAAEEQIAALVAVPDQDRTEANTLWALDDVRDGLAQAGGRYAFLAEVTPDPETRAAARRFRLELAEFTTRLGFREDLYQALRALARLPVGQALAGESRRYLDFALRDFRRNGFDLDLTVRTELQTLKERLVELGISFRRNIAEHEDELLLSRDQLAGLPEAYIDRLREVETQDGPKLRVSLDYPEFYPFLEAAQDESLRRRLFIKNHNRATRLNILILEEALALRARVAEVLGYGSWAEYVLELRMAERPETALSFLQDLERRVRTKAEQDIAELTALKRRETGDHEARLELWDWRYYQQQRLRERYDIDQFSVAEYFPLEETLTGMLSVYADLVGVRFTPVDDPRAWHPDVRLYAISDAESGEHIAHAYLDLHPRPDKYGHAAAFTLRPGRQTRHGYQPPVSAIVANFTRPTRSSPSLLRHSEVQTLFHEFGHILHQTLTRARFTEFSGSNVQRDFVEAPSQMLEHWVWDARVLAGFARHHRDGRPLPASTLARLVESKHVASGLFWLRQIYFARLDLAYHGAARVTDTDAAARELHPITGFPFPEGTQFQAGFGHLFGYDAGYYGYLWAKVFGDDMFTRFRDDRDAAGRDYRRLILEPGGSVDAAELLRSFLGREPASDAFLADIGLAG